jgi:hypothetical protein
VRGGAIIRGMEKITQHKDDLNEKLSKNERLEKQIFRMKAKERLGKFIDYIKSKKLTFLDGLSEDDALKVLESVDLAYDSGLVIADRPWDYIFRDIKESLSEELESFDKESIVNFCTENFPGTMFYLPLEQESYSNLALIFQGHKSQYGYSCAQEEYASSEYVDSKEKRIEKFKKFIEQFRKFPNE